jgi:hypothetical protein
MSAMGPLSGLNGHATDIGTNPFVSQRRHQVEF